MAAKDREDVRLSEADLGAPVASLCRQLWPGCEIAEEIDITWAAPDIVAAVATSKAVESSLALGSLQLGSAEFIAALGVAAPADLRACNSMSLKALATQVLAPLEARGIVEATDGGWMFKGWGESPFQSVHTVELKLRDWRKVMTQAARNQVMADTSWAAMPVACWTPAALAAAKNHGVGAIAVEDEVAYALLEAKPLHGYDMLAHRLLCERLLHARSFPSMRAAGTPVRAGDQRTAIQESRNAPSSPLTHARLSVA